MSFPWEKRNRPQLTNFTNLPFSPERIDESRIIFHPTDLLTYLYALGEFPLGDRKNNKLFTNNSNKYSHYNASLNTDFIYKLY